MHGHGLALELREVGVVLVVDVCACVGHRARGYQPTLSSPRRSFPCALRGSSRDELGSRFGTLCGARRWRQKPRSSSSPGVAPSRRHHDRDDGALPLGVLRRRSRRHPPRPGCSSSACSTCSGETFSPPVTITSSARPSTYRCPSSSMRPRSPVRSQPSGPRARGRHGRPAHLDHSVLDPDLGGQDRRAGRAGPPRRLARAAASSPARPPR